jgi:hypothetical protein
MYGVVCYISEQNDKTEMLQWQYVMYKEDQDDTYAKGNYLHFASASQHCVTYVWPCCTLDVHAPQHVVSPHCLWPVLLSAFSSLQPAIKYQTRMQHWTCTECTVEIKQCDANQIRTGGTVKAPIFNHGRELAKSSTTSSVLQRKQGP